MQHPTKAVVVGGLFGAVLLALAGCDPVHPSPMTVDELMEDRIALDGVLLKCNASMAVAHGDPDCHNARVAIERLAKEVDPLEAAQRNAEFERAREHLRQAQERLRQDQELRARVDAYDLPVASEPTSAVAAPAAGGAIMSQAGH